MAPFGFLGSKFHIQGETMCDQYSIGGNYDVGHMDKSQWGYLFIEFHGAT